MKSDSVWELWEIGKNASGQYFRFSNQPREADIQSSARQFADELRRLLHSLLNDPRAIRFLIRLEADGALVAEETQRGLGKWP